MRSVVVCDATCLERNLNLVLQILELSTQVIVCVNLMDEARRKGILLDLDRLSALLGVPVVSTVAQCKASQEALMQVVDQVMDGTLVCTPHLVTYPPEHRAGAVPAWRPGAGPAGGGHVHSATMAGAEPAGAGRRTVPDPPSTAGDRLSPRTDAESRPDQRPHPTGAGRAGRQASEGCGGDLFGDRGGAHQPHSVVTYQRDGCHSVDRKLDRILTSKAHRAIPVMLLLLALVFWITIAGANIPSSAGCPTVLFWVEEQLQPALCGASRTGLAPRAAGGRRASVCWPGWCR